MATTTLPHETFPAAAVVSPAGHVVTLDEYHEPGWTDAVVVMDRTGAVLARYDLTDLMDEDEIAVLGRSDCGRPWRDGAAYYFLLEPDPRFYVVLARGPVLEFDLANGVFRRGPAESFPELARVRALPFANERVEPWAISLRFSSITDVLRATSSGLRNPALHDGPVP